MGCEVWSYFEPLKSLSGKGNQSDTEEAVKQMEVNE